jgi:hypothetical protein
MKQLSLFDQDTLEFENHSFGELTTYTNPYKIVKGGISDFMYPAARVRDHVRNHAFNIFNVI